MGEEFFYTIFNSFTNHFSFYSVFKIYYSCPTLSTAAMDALGGGFWWWRSFHLHREQHYRRRRRPKSSSSSSDSVNLTDRAWFLSDFPLKQAAIAASLTLTGDTVAQIRDRFLFRDRRLLETSEDKVSLPSLALAWQLFYVVRSYPLLNYALISERMLTEVT